MTNTVLKLFSTFIISIYSTSSTYQLLAVLLRNFCPSLMGTGLQLAHWYSWVCCTHLLQIPQQIRFKLCDYDDFTRIFWNFLLKPSLVIPNHCSMPWEIIRCAWKLMQFENDYLHTLYVSFFNSCNRNSPKQAQVSHWVNCE